MSNNCSAAPVAIEWFRSGAFRIAEYMASCDASESRGDDSPPDSRADEYDRWIELMLAGVGGTDCSAGPATPTCAVCKENATAVMSADCPHACMCRRCARLLFESWLPFCPICRAPFAEPLRLVVFA